MFNDNNIRRIATTTTTTMMMMMLDMMMMTTIIAPCNKPGENRLCALFCNPWYTNGLLFPF